MKQELERLEHLISRRIDGEIGEAEQHELNKLLIRSPEARRLAEVIERQDGLVRSALDDLLGKPLANPLDCERAGALAGAPLARVRFWPMATAAVLALSIGTSLYLGVNPSGGVVARHTQAAGASIPVDPMMAGMQMLDGNEGPRLERRAVSHDVIAVLGEDGRTVYLFERNRTRTATSPFGDDL
jgi:anti-sigma factor RsiW